MGAASERPTYPTIPHMKERAWHQGTAGATNGAVILSEAKQTRKTPRFLIPRGPSTSLGMTVTPRAKRLMGGNGICGNGCCGNETPFDTQFFFSESGRRDR